ncbi:MULTISPECIES: hypothetical protein [unclassified Leeuwenhoekiella]|uniref:hypothetical protein n=1 Tax=unclassified Leeuwenhoekiella TaxID=2615029 RepID=UPI000C4513A7|nr:MULTISPECIES: hypothetical protein [unclassified Leeuwenhoekiella]MAW95025.1 hypothetical protein [Leeuwenhoekiella sp.]MBA79745.1 hypothetical protein [Leeuwenhoekiella sp.]|tara:strand:+ start:35254 stop:35574 length:321 start_codon:yes stop_codon:yes gene_type:complete
MVFKSKNIQILISFVLIVAVFAFKVADLHKYVHDKDELNNHHCELCLLSQKQKNQSDFYLPEAYSGLEQKAVFISDLQKNFFYTFIKNVPVLTGKSLNKAPPTKSV